MIQFGCPTCGMHLQHPTPGDKVHCPNCGQRVQVPAPPAPAPTINKTVLGTQASRYAIDLPPFICLKVFRDGSHHIEFGQWTAEVVAVDKTVKTFVTGGGGGYVNTDFEGRVYGSFYNEPVHTHHQVEYAYWLRDDWGQERRLYIPEALGARPGQTLTCLHAKPANSRGWWKLVAIINHETGEYIGPHQGKSAEMLFDPVPPNLVEWFGLAAKQRAAVIFGIVITLAAVVCIPSGLLFAGLLSANSSTGGHGRAAWVLITLAVLFPLLLVLAWIPYSALSRKAERRSRPYLDRREKAFAQLFQQCRRYCEQLAAIR